jgi:hypothetical protein
LTPLSAHQNLDFVTANAIIALYGKTGKRRPQKYEYNSVGNDK